MTTSKTRAAALCAFLATSAYCVLTPQPAAAQEASVVAFPVRQFPDENGVDLLSGVFTAYTPSVSIGSADMGLSYVRALRANLYRDSMMGSIDIAGSTYRVDIGGKSEAFTLSGGIFTPAEQNGSTLTLAGNAYTYRRADGTTATFTSVTRDFGNAAGIVITSLLYPSGRSLDFHYTEANWTNPLGAIKRGRRLQSVTTNAGWHLKLSYQGDVPNGPSGGTWSKLANVKGLNSAVDACDVSAFSCPQTGRPQLGIPAASGGSQSYVDSEGRAINYTFTGSVLTGVRLPGSAADDVSVVYVSGKVSSVTRSGVTTAYAFSDLSGVRTVTVTRPGGSSRVVTFDIAKSVMLSDQDELGRTTSYQYDASNRPARVTAPEGNYTAFTYDLRGNVTETRSVAKPGSGLADFVETAQYDPTCTVTVKCNKPNSVTDARGNMTQFTWDSTHGGLLTTTAPAVGGVNPQTRIGYQRVDSTGGVNPNGIFVPTSISQCQTAASCAGTADEVRTDIGYGPGVLPISHGKGSGDGALLAFTAKTYDAAGNLLTVDGPLPGTADTIRYRYNSTRELVGTVSPGSGRRRPPQAPGDTDDDQCLDRNALP